MDIGTKNASYPLMANTSLLNICWMIYPTVAMKLRGGPTQDEVMAVALHKLGLRKEDRFADIGCGTAKVSIAASPRVREVVAIDDRPEAIEVARAEIAASGEKNITLVERTAKEYLRECGPIDAAFVGGTRDLEDVLELLSEKVRRTIVVDAVMLGTLHKAIDTMTRLDIFKEAVQLNVSRSYNIAGGIMLRPIDPVFIIVGEVDGC
jgi:cobalt-precorrin-6B (C15)-methyltransferase